MKRRFTALLDWIALGALTSAAGLLAGGLWFVDSFLTPLFLQGFASALALSVGSFLVARALQLSPYFMNAWENSYPQTQPIMPAARSQQPMLELVSDRSVASQEAAPQGLDNAA